MSIRRTLLGYASSENGLARWQRGCEQVGEHGCAPRKLAPTSRGVFAAPRGGNAASVLDWCGLLRGSSRLQQAEVGPRCVTALPSLAVGAIRATGPTVAPRT